MIYRESVIGAATTIILLGTMFQEPVYQLSWLRAHLGGWF